MSNLDYTHLLMVARGGSIDDVIKAIDCSGAYPQLVEILEEAVRGNENEYSYEELAEKCDEQGDKIDMLEGIAQFMDKELCKFISDLVLGIVEAKGGKKKTKDLVWDFVNSIENASLSSDSQEFISEFLSNIQNIPDQF